MNLITDTFIGKHHFRQVVDDERLVAFQCRSDELTHMHMNLCEWVRQLEVEMASRGYVFEAKVLRDV
jgi:hypothetical protein